MTNLTEIHDKRFSIIFIEDDGSEDGKWSVLTGIAKYRDDHLFLFRGDDIPEFPIPDDTLDRIKPVLPETKDFLGNAEYCTMLFVGPLPDNADPNEFTHTGLNMNDL